MISKLFPLNSGAGLGSEVIEDTVHVVDLGGDAVCDMLEKLEGDILDGGGHCVTGIDRADDDGVSEGARVILNADRLEIGHDGEVLPDFFIKPRQSKFLPQNSVRFANGFEPVTSYRTHATNAESRTGERLTVNHRRGQAEFSADNAHFVFK